MTGIEKLLKRAKGSPTAVARKLTTKDRECSRQIVQHWKKFGYVPSTWAPHVASVTGIPLHELNPKVYPKSIAA